MKLAIFALFFLIAVACAVQAAPGDVGDSLHKAADDFGNGAHQVWNDLTDSAGKAWDNVKDFAHDVHKDANKDFQ